MTSLCPQNAGPRQLLDLARIYRGAIENGVHRVRDCKPHKDACRARKGILQGVLAAFNSLALSILRMLDHKNIAPSDGRVEPPTGAGPRCTLKRYRTATPRSVHQGERCIRARLFGS